MTNLGFQFFISLLILTLYISSIGCQRVDLLKYDSLIVKDKSYISGHDSIEQLVTTKGILFHNPKNDLVDTVPHISHTLSAGTYGPSQALIYDETSLSLLLLQEVYDPLGYDDEPIIIDSIHLKENIKQVSLIQPDGTSGNYLDIKNNKGIAEEFHAVSSVRNTTLYYKIVILNGTLSITHTNRVIADSIIYNYSTITPLFIESNLYGLLTYHDKAEYLSIQPFKYNYARAQHRSGIWGYLRKDGKWFADE